MHKYPPSANKIRLASIRYLWTLLYTLSPFAILPFSLFHISTPQSRDPRLVSPSRSVDMTIRGIANSSEAWPFKPDRLFYGLHLQSCIVVRSHPRLPSPTRPPTLAARRHPRKRVFCLVLSHSHGRAIIPLNTRVHARAVCRHRRDAADTRVYTRPRYPISFRSGTETQPPGEERSAFEARASRPDCHFDPERDSAVLSELNSPHHHRWVEIKKKERKKRNRKERGKSDVVYGLLWYSWYAESSFSWVEN